MALTDRDSVRLLATDVGGTSGTDFVFSDDEIDGFLTMRSGNIFRAAALALRTLAANEALVSKRIKFLGLETDGPAVAKELRTLAAELDTTADNEDADEGEIDVIEMDTTIFADRQMRGTS